MHGLEYKHTDDDKKYANVNSPVHDNPNKKYSVAFNYNSDLSGEVYITLFDDTTQASIQRVWVPGWMLLDFVGSYCMNEAIATIENCSGKEFLKRMTT